MTDEPKPPTCLMCGAPVESRKEIEIAERVAKRVSEKYPHGGPVEPRYFCSNECVRARYIG